MDPAEDPDREPMPERMEPMLATTGSLPADDDGWAYEIGRACVGKECRSLCDWSSDVCSSDLDGSRRGSGPRADARAHGADAGDDGVAAGRRRRVGLRDRKSVCRERV